ncbi:MAG: cupin domain-containing protein [Clostridiales bacterium]|nr:cupin domain-containing protein [Clostridiales bacterium]
MKISPNEFIEDIRSNMKDGKGDVVINHVQKDGLPEKCRLFANITLEPGCSIGHHVHHQETEFYTILKGVATVDDDGTSIEVSAGDVVVTPNGKGHSIENTGDETMEMLAIIVLD